MDGCWEPILNGISDWTFGMLNCMPILQCTINRGASLDTNPGMLRGGKLSFISYEVANYEEFHNTFKKYMQFFIDQSTFSLYECYMMDEVREAMKVDFTAGKSEVELQERYQKMREDFNVNSPKFGDVASNEVANFIVNTSCDAVEHSKKLADKVFLYPVRPDKETKLLMPEQVQILHLRQVAGYYGVSFKERFGRSFNMHFTADCGIFEQFPQQGLGIVASANRHSNDPMTANFSPVSGTIRKGVDNVFESYKNLPMDRLSAGAIVDLCIDESQKNEAYIMRLLDKFRETNGNMLTLAFGNKDVYQKIYQLCYDAANTQDNEALYQELDQYKHINVRVGG